MIRGRCPFPRREPRDPCGQSTFRHHIGPLGRPPRFAAGRAGSRPFADQFIDVVHPASANVAPTQSRKKARARCCMTTSQSRSLADTPRRLRPHPSILAGGNPSFMALPLCFGQFAFFVYKVRCASNRSGQAHACLSGTAGPPSPRLRLGTAEGATTVPRHKSRTSRYGRNFARAAS